MISNGLGLGYVGQAIAQQGFRHYDINHDGVLDRFELKNMMNGDSYHYGHHGHHHNHHHSHHYGHHYPNYHGSQHYGFNGFYGPSNYRFGY